jgi:enoyl-CoA hydratase/carnithine racemase
MHTVRLSVKDNVAVLALDRGKANAINTEMVEELRKTIARLYDDDSISGMIITGKEGFFSAGLDLIEIYDYNEHQIREFWNSFMQLISELASFKKPAIAAINGHCPAGGCVLSLCCDYRIMADGKYIIGLNELPVSIIAPAGIFYLYGFWLGNANAYRFLLEGKLMNPAEALSFGLIDKITSAELILAEAESQLQSYLKINQAAWQQSKVNLRKDLIEKLNTGQAEMIEVMLKQWWSPETRATLQTIIDRLHSKSKNV